MDTHFTNKLEMFAKNDDRCNNAFNRPWQVKFLKLTCKLR